MRATGKRDERAEEGRWLVMTDVRGAAGRALDGRSMFRGRGRQSTTRRAERTDAAVESQRIYIVTADCRSHTALTHRTRGGCLLAVGARRARGSNKFSSVQSTQLSSTTHGKTAARRAGNARSKEVRLGRCGANDTYDGDKEWRHRDRIRLRISRSLAVTKFGTT